MIKKCNKSKKLYDSYVLGRSIFTLKTKKQAPSDHQPRLRISCNKLHLSSNSSAPCGSKYAAST